MADALAAIGERISLTSTPMSDAALVALCKDGDENAFALVYQRHAARVYRQLRGLLRESEVEDALQQTFAEAFRNIDKFEERSLLSTWLHGIAVRVALNIIRSHRRRHRTMSALEEHTAATPQRRPTSPETKIASRQDLARLHRHLSDAPADSQLAFRLYYVEQLELGEVAQRLRLSPGATWARIKRARSRILEAIAREQLLSEEDAP